MALDRYGVLAARALQTAREDGSDTPHLQVHLLDAAHEHWRVAVNVESRQPPSELLYLVDDDFRHPVTAALEPIAAGWHPLAPGAAGPHLDYIRGNLFDRARMRLLPSALAGPDNDLSDLLDHWLRRAASRPGGDGVRLRPALGSRGGRRRHGVRLRALQRRTRHPLNQGNPPPFHRDNGVRQDGALLVHFPQESRWVAIFLAFQSQAAHTDDTTGHPLDASGEPVTRSPPRSASSRRWSTRAGPAPEAESVLLLNASPAAVDLTGWRIADRGGQTCPVPGGPLAAGDTRRVAISGRVTLGNGGATITLLDAGGLKVSGVAYTAADARREGWTVTF